MSTKKTTPHWIAIGILGSLLALGLFKVVVVGDTAQGDDGRTAVLLTPAERQAVLAEMRGLLEATRGVVGALAKEDRPGIEAAARPVGSAAISTMDFSLRAKLPLEFKTLGFGTHGAFDTIADMASEGRPMREIQLKLAETMDNCIACHATYQLPATR